MRSAQRLRELRTSANLLWRKLQAQSRPKVRCKLNALSLTMRLTTSNSEKRRLCTWFMSCKIADIQLIKSLSKRLSISRQLGSRSSWIRILTLWIVCHHLEQWKRRQTQRTITVSTLMTLMISSALAQIFKRRGLPTYLLSIFMDFLNMNLALTKKTSKL